MPFPSNSGVRCDMARRLKGFHALGHEVFAIGWFSLAAGERPSAQALEELDSHVEDRMVLPIGATAGAKLRRLANLHRYPSYVASRIPSAPELAELEARVKAFAPQVIWLEGVHPAWLALHLSARLDLPLVYRAHNVEHAYLNELARLARSPRQKLALQAGTWGLRDFEERLRTEAVETFDISSEDLAWWQGEGFPKGRTLLTQADPEFLDAGGDGSGAQPKDLDLLYFGGLSSPNNIAGLEWFFDQVLPEIRRHKPSVSIGIAGRNPPQSLIDRVRAEGLELFPSPPSLAPLIARSRVLINPILHGSGVNVKTIDMFSSGLPLVTTGKGARGLSPDVTTLMRLADDPSDFARQALQAIDTSATAPDHASRKLVIEQRFSFDALDKALLSIQWS